MLSEIVTRLIDEQVDMETVSVNAPDTATQLPGSNIRSADVLLMACDKSEAASKARAILERWPLIRVIALTGNGHDATIYEMKPRETYAGAISMVSLIDSIREVCRC